MYRPHLEPHNWVAGSKGEHVVRTTYTPISERVVCSCGWRHTETRRQNALARAAKVRAAVNRHLNGV